MKWRCQAGLAGAGAAPRAFREKLPSMRTLLLGPFLSLLPRRWRLSLPDSSSVNWPIAAAISGALEFLLAVLAFLCWYSYSVTHWAQDAVGSAIRNGADIPPNGVGVAALATMFLHPLTWLIILFQLEAIVRFLAGAFTGKAFGTFPLFVLEKLVGPRASHQTGQQAADTEKAWSSFSDAIRQRVRLLWLPAIPDEIVPTKDATGDALSIRSSRPKSGWDPPHVVFSDNVYYRLERVSEQSGARPYVYFLRRLPAGVPGRSVIQYSPQDSPQKK
jgi:hypothetical protein